MWIENQVFKDDMDYIINADFIKWDKLKNKTVFITGATGLIGYYVVSSLIYKNIIKNYNINIIALVRNLDKAKKIFEEQLKSTKKLSFIKGDIEKIPYIKYKIDYIIHAASPTASDFFASKPVETIRINFNGTMNVLELAKEKQIISMLYLSTMEIYGSILTEEKVNESHPSFLDTMSARNSYPECKRLCENLCASYCSEYNVPVNVIRLTQTFGPGIKKEDNRVFAQFIKASIEKKDIVLFTEGKTCRSYLYLADAVTAILTILLSGKVNEVYNAANEDTYCSIREMANLVAENINNSSIKVIRVRNESKTKSFMPQMYMNLDTSKLKALEWDNNITLYDMYSKTIRSIK